MNTSIAPTTASTAAPSTRKATASHQTRNRVLEGLAALALLVVAGIHLSELSGKFREVPYLGVGYVGLIASSVVAIGLILVGNRTGWMLGGLACLLTIIGFVLTRTTGLPQSMDDIGNWGEPIAVASLVAEGLVVLFSGWTLSKRASR